MKILTPFDSRSEDVRVPAIVIAELELGNVQRHIFVAHFVERADHTALEDRPEAFDSLGMDRSDDLWTFGVVNDPMGVFTIKTFVARPLVGAKQADLMRNRFADKSGKSVGAHFFDNASDHVALAFDRADDWSFAGTNAASRSRGNL